MENQKHHVSLSGLAITQSSASEKQHSFEQLKVLSEHSADEQTQSWMINDDLMKIIDDCCDSNMVSSFEVSKINENSKNSPSKCVRSLDSLNQRNQPSKQPDQFRSIFSQHSVWTPPAVANSDVSNSYAYPENH